MSDNRMSNIMNNIFDIIISLVRIGVGYMKDFIIKVSETMESTRERKEENMWNGGVTNGHANGYEVKDITDTPYDESNVIYDGVYDDWMDGYNNNNSVLCCVL